MAVDDWNMIMKPPEKQGTVVERDISSPTLCWEGTLIASIAESSLSRSARRVIQLKGI